MAWHRDGGVPACGGNRRRRAGDDRRRAVRALSEAEHRAWPARHGWTGGRSGRTRWCRHVRRGQLPDSALRPRRPRLDAAVMAASTVLRLQTIVSRELAPTEAAVVTIGALQAGSKENVIPDEAIIKLNVRTFDEGVRKRVLAAIERIVNAEAEASGAPKPPEITPLDRYQLVRNDPAAADRVRAAFHDRFGA